MQAYISQNNYDFVLTKKEACNPEGKLETELLDGETRESTGKTIRLIWKDPEFGDAQLDAFPENVVWNEAINFTITARQRYLDQARKEEHSNARLGNIGDVYFHVGNNPIE